MSVFRAFFVFPTFNIGHYVSCVCVWVCVCKWIHFFVQEFNSRAFIVQSTKLSITQAHRLAYTLKLLWKDARKRHTNKISKCDCAAKGKQRWRERERESEKKSSMSMETEKRAHSYCKRLDFQHIDMSRIWNNNRNKNTSIKKHANNCRSFLCWFVPFTIHTIWMSRFFALRHCFCEHIGYGMHAVQYAE